MKKQRKALQHPEKAQVSSPVTKVVEIVVPNTTRVTRSATMKKRKIIEDDDKADDTKANLEDNMKCCKEPNPIVKKKKPTHFGDDKFHNTAMFSDLWKEGTTRYQYCVSEMEIEAKMEKLWLENKEAMGVDFNYIDYDSKMEEFDQNIRDCEAIVNHQRRYEMIRKYKMYKKDAASPYRHAKRFFTKNNSRLLVLLQS